MFILHPPVGTRPIFWSPATEPRKTRKNQGTSQETTRPEAWWLVQWRPARDGDGGRGSRPGGFLGTKPLNVLEVDNFEMFLELRDKCLGLFGIFKGWSQPSLLLMIFRGYQKNMNQSARAICTSQNVIDKSEEIHKQGSNLGWQASG